MSGMPFDIIAYFKDGKRNIEEIASLCPVAHDLIVSQDKRESDSANAFEAAYNTDKQWLNSVKKRMSQEKDAANIAACLGEVRAFSTLNDIWGNIIPHYTNKGPDFSIGEDPESPNLDVEVFTIGARPNATVQLEHIVVAALDVKVSDFAPYGQPDPHKVGESIAANMVSYIASRKQGEKQLVGCRPTLLFLDFQNLPLNSSQIEHTQPMIPDEETKTVGGIWAAFYGMHGLPLMQDSYSWDRFEVPRMGHNGKFYVGNTSSAVGALLSFYQGGETKLVYMENPSRAKDFPFELRRKLIDSPKLLKEMSWFNSESSDLTGRIQVASKMITEAYQSL